MHQAGSAHLLCGLLHVLPEGREKVQIRLQFLRRDPGTERAHNTAHPLWKECLDAGAQPFLFHLIRDTA